MSVLTLLLALTLLPLALAGCSGLSLAETLTARAVTSCLWYQGSAGPYASLTGVSATGGATLATCLDARRP